MNLRHFVSLFAFASIAVGVACNGDDVPVGGDKSSRLNGGTSDPSQSADGGQTSSPGADVVCSSKACGAGCSQEGAPQALACNAEGKCVAADSVLGCTGAAACKNKTCGSGCSSEGASESLSCNAQGECVASTSNLGCTPDVICATSACGAGCSQEGEPSKHCNAQKQCVPAAEPPSCSPCETRACGASCTTEGGAPMKCNAQKQCVAAADPLGC
jgi:hypothetical protein